MGNSNIYEDSEDTLKVECRTIDKPELCKNHITPYNKIKVLSFNIRSLNCNLPKLLPTLARIDCNIDAMVFSECWLQENSHIPQLPGYEVFYTKKKINKCGGVTIYVKNCWSASIQEPVFEDANCLIVNVENCLKIVGIYRSPAVNDLEKFNDSLEKILASTKHQSTVLVTGDININLLEEPPNTNNASYQCLMASQGFLPTITEPTRGKTCLDHAFIKSKGKCIGVICNTSVTDHNLLLIGLTTKSQKFREKSRSATRTNFHEISKELKQVDWRQVLEKEDVDEAVLTLNKIMSDCINKHTKKIKISRSKLNLKPWITPGLIRCMRHRDNLHLQLRKDPQNETLKTTYTRYKNFCNNLLHRLKIEHDNTKLTQNHSNPKHLWKAIKEVCDIPCPKKNSNELLSNSANPHEALNNCNRHFSNTGANLASSILSKLKISHETLSQQLSFESRCSNSLFLAPTDHNEIIGIIQNLNPTSAPGIDTITPLILKYAKEALIEPLSHICNLSMSSGIFPDCWKTAVVILIHKSGDKSNPDNYRPISLLSIVSKILEKLVNKRLVDFLQKHNLLSDRQFGFRKGKSTEHAVELLTETVASHLDRKQRCLGVFLDLARAFDSISTPILLKKLESCGIRGSSLSWFTSYLSNRQQCVKIGEISSCKSHIAFGVPQGSILAPILFTLYMDDIFRITIPNCELICYADDTAAIFHGKDWASVFKDAEHGMERLSRWLNVNLLTLNVKKSSIIAFHITEASGTFLSKLVVHDNCEALSGIKTNPAKCSCGSVDRVKSTKYLGVMVDENLSFSTHITYISKKVRKMLYIMKTLRASAKEGVKMLVYKSLCQSLLQYCIGAWGGAAKTHMEEAERAQRAMLKVMLGKPRRYPTDKLYEEASVLRVRQLFVMRAIVKSHHLSVHTSDKQGRQKRPHDVPLPRVNTTFAARLPKHVHIFTYNSVCRLIDIQNITFSSCKNKITHWLLSLSGEQTERLVFYTEMKPKEVFAPCLGKPYRVQKL